MLNALDCPSSCGVRLLRGEQEYVTAETYFKDVARLNYDSDHRNLLVYTHSEVAHPEIGDKIAKYIHDNNLGFVVKSKPGGNPIHGGREITVWVWTRDSMSFTNHCVELRKVKDVSGTNN